MINLVPMAGLGRRFAEIGYLLPKPLIPVMGQPMAVTSGRSFPPADRWVFLCQADHLSRYPLASVLKNSFANAEVITIDKPTEGMASTCLLAVDRLPDQESVLVSSCDYQVVFDRARYDAMAQDKSIDVIIWTFKSRGSIQKDPKAFAYCRVEDSRVKEVVEKRLISEHPEDDPAVVGTFFFRRAELLRTAITSMIAKNIRVNGEFYVGTSINQLIEQGLRVAAFDVDQFISFGDPLELKIFEFWESYFNNLKDAPYKRRFVMEKSPA